jgi:hypothetical protein
MQHVRETADPGEVDLSRARPSIIGEYTPRWMNWMRAPVAASR